MKKFVFASLFASFLTASAFAAAAPAKGSVDDKPMAGEIEKKGVLATEECIKKGYFARNTSSRCCQAYGKPAQPSGKNH